MPDLAELYERAQSSPNNFSFSDLCYLVEGLGYELKRSKGSHRIYKCKKIHDRYDAMINVQDYNGKAKPYQVRKVLQIIEAYDLL